MKVAVVGAGPTGCAAAVFLARAGAQVTLISDARHGVGEHLPAACRPLLDQLGVSPEGAVECTGFTAGDWHHDAIRHPLGGGWLLDRPAFGESLRAVVRRSSVEFLEPARLLGLEKGWRLQLDVGEVRCDFVVDASGRRAVVARRLGVQRHRYTRQRAWVQTLSGPVQDVDARLCVEDLENGWAYTCRIGPGRRVLARLGDKTWPEIDRLAPLLSGYSPQGEPQIVPADASLLEEVAGPGWLALGDAAATADPRAGQGLWAALRAGAAAPALVDATTETLRHYREEVRERFHRVLV